MANGGCLTKYYDSYMWRHNKWLNFFLYLDGSAFLEAKYFACVRGFCPWGHPKNLTSVSKFDPGIKFQVWPRLTPWHKKATKWYQARNGIKFFNILYPKIGKNRRWIKLLVKIRRKIFKIHVIANFRVKHWWKFQKLE